MDHHVQNYKHVKTGLLFYIATQEK